MLRLDKDVALTAACLEGEKQKHLCKVPLLLQWLFCYRFGSKQNDL